MNFSSTEPAPYLLHVEFVPHWQQIQQSKIHKHLEGLATSGAN